MTEWRNAESLYELMQERDRLYTERRDAMRRELDASNEAQQMALDKALQAALDARASADAKIDNLGRLGMDAERRISALEAGRSQDTGRREPVHEVVKWLGAMAIAASGWIAGHFTVNGK
jgi:hypothetical protein